MSGTCDRNTHLHPLILSDTLSRLYARIPLGMRLGLDPMLAACERTHHPEGAAFVAVHVAGTNGKGSVCAMVEAMARAQGKKTGLYTSPHLSRFAERIRIDGEPLSDDALTDVLGRALDEGPDLSFFETATLAAFLAFREAKVEIGVVEVGLGGRLDATNVLPSPRAAAITRIALDHVDRLGTTLVEIAREKAGIAKVGLDIVLGDMPPEVRAAIDEVALAQGATTSTAEDVRLPGPVALEGEHQKENARIAVRLAPTDGARRREPSRRGSPGCAGQRGSNASATCCSMPPTTPTAPKPSRAMCDRSRFRPGGWPSSSAPSSTKTGPPCSTRSHRSQPCASMSPRLPHPGLPSNLGVAAARHPGQTAGSIEEALAIARREAPSLIVVAGSLVLVGGARACCYWACRAIRPSRFERSRSHGRIASDRPCSAKKPVKARNPQAGMGTVGPGKGKALVGP